MRALRTKILLRECIKEILKEDGDAGNDLGGMMGGMDSPYGMHYADNNQMYQIFVKPFTDVVGMAAGKTKELSTKTQTLLRVAFESMATALIPFLKDSYTEIFAKEKKQIEKIRSEYASVYNATWDAFKKNDVLVAAFMYRPDLFLTAQFATKAPKAAAKLMSILSGGLLDQALKKVIGNKDGEGDGTGDQANFWDEISKRAASSNMGGKQKRKRKNKFKAESVLREETKQELNPIAKLASNEKVKEALTNSDMVKQMTKQGREMVRGTLKDVFENAKAVLSATSIQDIQQKTGKKIPGLEKLAQVPQQERQKTEQDLLKSVKSGMKEFYTKQLEAQVKSAIDAGVPQDHPYVKDYAGVISKIKSL